MGKVSTFSDFAHIIDARLLRALADLGFSRPTTVQAQVIPLAIEGKDILARARTGSGKTAAYCIPLIQKILSAKATDGSEATRGMILVPTRELSEQVTKHLQSLLPYCDREVKVVNIASNLATNTQKVLLSESADIIVATPSRAIALLQSKDISVSSLETLVIDEADLIFSFGHDEDMIRLVEGGYLPQVFQSFLMSATMTKDVQSLKGLVLRDPVLLELDQQDDESANLSQYAVRTSEVDKFLLTYVMLKLRLIKGKCILFVNDVNRCYRLKLFLEQFSIKSCVLNSELPLNSRVHIVQEFNKGVYDYIIATDESAGKGDADGVGNTSKEVKTQDLQQDEDATDREESEKVEPVSDVAEGSSSSKKRKRDQPPPAQSSNGKKGRRKGKKGKDREYGVTRGVDFVDVSCVLNFDLPTSSRGYIHRVGRTARAGRTGMSLSFILPKHEYGKNKVVGCIPTTMKDEEVWERINREQAARGCQIVDYKFDQSKIESFRYRMEDALRSVTKAAIKEGRIKDLKNEILKSDKLKAHFEDNPLDLDYLRHDKPLHPTRVQPHMKAVPKYLLPATMVVNEGTSASGETSVGFVPFKKPRPNARVKGHWRGGKKKSDPLRKFKR